MDVNDPAVIRTIAGLLDEYDAALAANDTAALDAFFWSSPHVVRFGVAEQWYGIDEVRAHRTAGPPVPRDRVVVRREIATFGGTVATVMSEVAMLVDGTQQRRRLSQTWVQIPGLGWRIVAAHASMPFAPSVDDSPWRRYADMLAGSLGLTLDDPRRAGMAAG